MAALHRLARALVAERGLEGSPPVEQLALHLELDLRRGDPRAEAASLVAALARRVDDALVAAGSWRQGHVYCFQCDAPGCRHARPPRASAAFAGYSATGKPVWQGFAELCIDRGDERTARIFGDRPEVIALVQPGDALHVDVLPTFAGTGRPLAVLGQVVAGLLPASYASELGRDPHGAPSAPERVAMTVQVVDLPGARRGGRLRLNLIGTSWDAIAKAHADEGHKSSAQGLRSALAAARHRLQAQSRHLAKRGGDLHAVVEPVLADLQRDIERVFRGHRWRTRHAEHRHRSGERPTIAAVSEARSAPTQRLLFDTERKTLVVLGRKGRAHVFSPDGRHVTSLQLGAGELERKTDRGRWRSVPEVDAARFRAALEARRDRS